MGGPPSHGDHRQGGFGQKDETTFVVPADKTGLVIGKGGETVKEINRITGCWVELSRDRPPNPHDRVFHLSGAPDQIQQAIGMICEKAGLPPPNGPGGGPPGPGGFGGPPSMGGPPGGPGGFNQGMPHQGGPPGNGGPPQGWGNSYNNWNQPQAPQQDPNKQQADANAAAWAAYYQQSYYGQGQQPPQQPAVAQPQAFQQSQQTQQPAAAATPAPTINPSTGQPDYSMAWADYYRQQGMHSHAQAILQQAQQPPQ